MAQVQPILTTSSANSLHGNLPTNSANSPHINLIKTQANLPTPTNDLFQSKPTTTTVNRLNFSIDAILT